MKSKTIIMYYHCRLTVTRETPNKGRQFYGCSKVISAPDRCNFFLWADESAGPPNIQPHNNRVNTQNNIGQMNNSYRARGGNSEYLFYS